ncbi:alpha/beta hydrolase [Algisphaera agarilytica]|nr:alpha/beta fold hydrolase [Algisphaera agarilytica]
MALGAGAILWQMNKPRRKTLGVVLAMGGAVEPADLELEGEEVTFNLSDGSASPGWIVTGDVANGPAAVVVHGHRDSRFGSLYRAQMLRPYCSHIAVFDLPGHGDAQAKRCLMGDREAEDIHAVVDGLPEGMVGEAGLVLLGYSMGATFVLKAAALWPELVERGGVIACAPYRWWDEGLRGQMKRRALPTWPMVPLVAGVLHAASRMNLSLGERPGFDRADDAAALQSPLLVLHGDEDTICPLSAGQAIAEAAPRGELAVIEGGTHNQLLGADYDAVHTALSGFFKKLGKQP